MVKVIVWFGILIRHGLEVSNEDGSLTEALREKQKEAANKWQPWKQVEIIGYDDPFA